MATAAALSTAANSQEARRREDNDVDEKTLYLC